MKKIIFVYLYSVFCILYSPPKVFGASDFTTSFLSEYTIEASGRTTVTHTITLKNNLAHIYATTYTIATSGDYLSDITARDESGVLSSSINVQPGITTIKLDISHPAIGQDQLKTIYLSYTTDDVVEKIGGTTTINIPRLAKANEAESYTRVVRLAGMLDQPKFISPPANTIVPTDKYTTYTFVGHQNDSLTLLFGDSVTYQVNLTYELKNPELKGGVSELALPMDTPYQQVLLDSLSPAPENIRIDENGNWLASYKLKSQEKTLVKAVLYVTVYPVPTSYDPSLTGFQKTPHSLYWDTTSPVVVDLATRLKNPLNIYNYLVGNFTYNFSGPTSNPTRLGATKALSGATGVLCTEFTDSFISLARSLHIPSREINGFGYTKNDSLQPSSPQTDILHSWPEYYDDGNKTWLSIDPTWGNTTGGVDYFHKLDYGHIAFVRHGSEDSYPLPAGAYKSDASQKYVEVNVAETIPPKNKTLAIQNGRVYNRGNVGVIHGTSTYLPPYGSASLDNSHPLSFYDKIKALCAKLLSKFLQRQPVST